MSECLRSVTCFRKDLAALNFAGVPIVRLHLLNLFKFRHILSAGTDDTSKNEDEPLEMKSYERTCTVMLVCVESCIIYQSVLTRQILEIA